MLMSWWRFLFMEPSAWTKSAINVLWYDAVNFLNVCYFFLNLLFIHLYRGALKFFMKSFVLAIRDLTKAVSIDVTCALAYFNRAVCYHANDDRPKVVNLFLCYCFQYNIVHENNWCASYSMSNWWGKCCIWPIVKSRV